MSKPLAWTADPYLNLVACIVPVPNVLAYQRAHDASDWEQNTYNKFLWWFRNQPKQPQEIQS